MFYSIGDMTDSSSQSCNSYLGKYGVVGVNGVTSNTHGLPDWQHPSTGDKIIWGQLICLGNIQFLSCTTGSSSYGWKRVRNSSTWSSL